MQKNLSDIVQFTQQLNEKLKLIDEYMGFITRSDDSAQNQSSAQILPPVVNTRKP